MSVFVVKPGMLTTVQDRGRFGHAAIGVGASGAMDRVLLSLAQALVGNGTDDAALEITISGPTLRFETSARIALTGDFVQARIDGVAVQPWRPLTVDAGGELACGPLASGTRGYLAIAGGLPVDAVLGSRSSDVNAHIGPLGGRPIIAGDRLPLTHCEPSRQATGKWSLSPFPWFTVDDDEPIRFIPGRHHRLLDATSADALERTQFRIAADSNRVGLRLDGAVLTLSEPVELVSAPVTFGTMQLPPGGQPIALMAEHPTTGGYPVIGQIAAVDIGRIAQRRPGAPLRLARITAEEAATRYRQRQRQLGALLRAIEERSRA